MLRFAYLPSRALCCIKEFPVVAAPGSAVAAMPRPHHSEGDCGCSSGVALCAAAALILLAPQSRECRGEAGSQRGIHCMGDASTGIAHAAHMNQGTHGHTFSLPHTRCRPLSVGDAPVTAGGSLYWLLPLTCGVHGVQQAHGSDARVLCSRQGTELPSP